MSRTGRAAVWALLTTAGTRIITLISLVVLARLLAPAEFGLLAFALVYITYAETVGDLGTGAALIYWKERREDAAQITFAISVAMGLFWFVLTLALAPAIATFFKNPAAASIVRVLAFGFLIKYLGTTHDALAQKDLRFRARLIPEVGMNATKAAVSILLATLGLGAWSLVWGHLSGLLIWTLAVWRVVPWRPRWHLPAGLAAPMLRYGRGIVAVNIVAALVHHADLAIVGRMLGATALGLYQIAYKIPEATITVLIWVISKVLFPAFARLEGEDLRRAYLQALKFVSVITVPISAGLFVAAEPLVRVVFGLRFAGAAPILQWLAIYAGLRSIGTHAGDILKATGRANMLAGFGVLKAALVVPTLIVAARYDVVTVAMALAMVTAVTVLLSIAIVMRVLNVGLAAMGRALRTSALSGLALILAALALQQVLGTTRPEVLLALTVATGVLAYTAAVFVLDRALFAQILQILPGRSRGAQT